MRAAASPKWFQLYVHPDRGLTSELIGRAEAAGYSALVCTVDTPVIGRRERDLKNGFVLPFRPSPRTVFDVARHPSWLLGWLAEGRFAAGNLAALKPRAPEGMSDFEWIMADPSVTPETLRWIRSIWKGPLLAKGILTVRDALLAQDCGVDGVIVSNHGGRQLDCVAASITALPDIAAAVASDMVVLLDGGVRRGSDVLKALSLGATAVLVGRPWLWGAAAGGEEGIQLVLHLLRNELLTALALMGRPSLAEVDETCIRHATRAAV